MSPKPKKKLCWNCEGNVNFKDENCPFCGVYLSPMSLSGDSNSNNLLNPPYQMDKTEEHEDQEVPEAPYAESSSESTSTLSPEAEKMGTDFRNLLLITTLLLTGTLFLLFASILLLFSQNGVFTLRWNSDIWFVYLGIALPMLFIGWQRLQQINDC